MLEDEHHAHHHGHTGVKWLDVILAGSAIMISVVSLVVSIAHGRTMERLVEQNELQVKASTLPILRLNTGNMTEAGRPAVHLDLSNGGTGPAVIDWFEVSYAGRPVNTVETLLRDCCVAKADDDRAGWISNRVSGQRLPAGQSIPAFTVPAAGRADTFRRLDKDGRWKVTARACFCSVLDQCWITDLRQTRPTPVAACGPSRPALTW